MASPIARTNTSINMVKVIDIPYHACFPSYFLNELLWKCNNLHKPTDFFLFRERAAPGAVLMSHAILASNMDPRLQWSLVVHCWNHYLFLLLKRFGSVQFRYRFELGATPLILIIIRNIICRNELKIGEQKKNKNKIRTNTKPAHQGKLAHHQTQAGHRAPL